MFSHDVADTPACKFFFTSTCRFGDKCALSHQRPVMVDPKKVTEERARKDYIKKSGVEDMQEHDMIPTDLLVQLSLEEKKQTTASNPSLPLPFGSISFARSAQLG